MKDKVFCKNCKWLKKKDNVSLFEYFFSCIYPENLTFVVEWFAPKKISIKHPISINKKNNCKWFEKKLRRIKMDKDYIYKKLSLIVEIIEAFDPFINTKKEINSFLDALYVDMLSVIDELKLKEK